MLSGGPTLDSEGTTLTESRIKESKSLSGGGVGSGVGGSETLHLSPVFTRTHIQPPDGFYI